MNAPENLQHDALRSWVAEMVDLCDPPEFTGATAPTRSTTV